MSKRNKITALAVLIFLLGVSIAFWGPNTSVAEEDKVKTKLIMPRDVDLKHSRQPMFTNVERVYVYVQYMDSRSRSDKKEKSIPQPLQKENVEKLLVDMYSVRFSSEKCGKALEYGLNRLYFHGCHDQPVQLMTKIDYGKYLAAKKRKEIPAGSMYVILNVRMSGYHPKHHSPEFEDAIVSYNVIHTRPGDNLFLSSTPHAFPITQDNTTIKKLLMGQIKSHIHQ